jgi:serine/threonine protein kinase, bacterial
MPRREALKILPAGVSSDSDFRARFRREADLAATLWHPHIVGVHDRGEFEGQLWLAMDFVDGADAAQLMRDRYPAGVPAAEVNEIVEAVAGALDYAHGLGLLHRDVKPANILLTSPDEQGEHRILLGDFGIARQLGDISGLTATNLTVGTVAYAAPEQLMGSDLDGRADQYALAATAFQLLTGAPPFQHSNPVAVISQHLSTFPPKLSDRRSDLARLDAVMSKALAKDPDERFSRCRQFANAFSGSAGASISDQGTEVGITVAASVSASPTTSPTSLPVRGTPSWTRPATAIAAVVALTLIGSLIFVGIQLSRSRQTASPPPTAPVTTPSTTPSPPPPPAPVPLPTAPVPPLAPTLTTTVTTTVAPSGPTLGESCSDFDKLAYDRNAGENLGQIVCDGNSWVVTGAVSGIHTVGTSCTGSPPFTMARSADDHLITCYPSGGVGLDPIAGPGSFWKLYSP